MSKAQTKISGRARSRAALGLSGLMLASLILSVFISRPYQAEAFVAADITNTSAAADTVRISETNVPIMNFVLPAPSDDPAVIHDGADATVAGSYLTDFTANERFSDEDHDDANDYADGAMIVLSADTTITSGEIITTGTADLTAFDIAEAGMEIFADTQTDDNTFSANEDIYRQSHNGGDVFANDGSSLLEDFPDAVKFYDSNTLGDDDLYDEGEAILADADADGRPSSGDSVYVSGDAGVAELVTGDNVYFDGSVADDAEYDANEVIWFDANADTNFDTGVDVILVGGAAPALTQTQFNTEQEVAYLDDNADGIYGCVRAAQCETIVYSGATGVNFDDDGDDLPTTTTFFDSSTEATDGIATTGNGWDEPGGSEDMVAFSATNDFYIVSVADAAYAAADDIFTLIHNGSQASGDGSEVRTMGGNDKYSDADNSATYTDGELIANSADANLAGAEIIVSGTVDVTAFDSSTTPFYKHADGGSDDDAYADGDDIYQDTDDSGYVDADRITSLEVNNSGTAVDGDISRMSVWIDDGDGNFESGEDTQSGNYAAAPFFDTAMALLGPVYTTTQRIFVTVDIDATTTDGATIIARLLENAGGDGDCDNSSANEAACSLQFASNDDGPSDVNITNANTITIDANVPTPSAAQITATIDTDGGTATIAGLTDTILVVWDANSEVGYENDIASVSADLSAFGGGAAVAMTEDNGGALDCDNDAAQTTVDVWCTLLTITAGAVDNTLLDATVTGTDDAGNVSSATTDDSDLSVDNQAPTVTDAAILTDGESGTGGAYKISDAVTVTWDNTVDANADETTVTVNYSEFGGGAAVAAADGGVAPDAGIDNVWTAAYTIVDDATDIDDADNNVSITVTDDAGNATTTADDDTLYTVDNVALTVSAGELFADETACTGTGGVCKLTDAIAISWDDSAATGDNNTDTVSSVTVDIQNYGGGAAQAITDGDADDVWTYSYTVVAGNDDGTLTFTATATDNAGNATTSAASTDTAPVDNVAPTVTDGAISISGATGTGGAYKIGDAVSAVWNNDTDGNADESTVTVSYTQFGGGAAVVATEALNVWTGTYTIVDDATDIDDADNNVSFTVTDDAGNAVTTADTTTATVDNVRVTITAAEVVDAGLNGIIDGVALTFSENLQNTAAAANGFDVTSAANHGTCTAESIDPAVSSSGTVAVTCTSAYTAVGDLNLVFTANAGIVDDAGNQLSTVTLTSASAPAITDNADPVLMTVSPASAGTSISRTADIIMTFSEPMTATFDEGTEFAVDDDPGAFVDAWTVGNTVVTLTHESSFGCSAGTTVTLTPAAVTSAAAEAMNTGGPQDEVWSFTTASCSSGSSGGGGSSSSAAATYSIGLDSPEGGEELSAGDEQAIRWTTGGTGTINYVDIFYTTDGATYVSIVDNTSNDGVYTWTVPEDLNSASVMIKVEATDLSDVLDSDLSEEFTVGSPEVAAEEEEAPAEEAEGSGEFGYSPVTGELEEISDISAGDYFRGASYDTVYYLTSDGERRPFMNSATYFTWRSSFSSVITVTDATLAAYSLGAPMLPKHGVVLIKIVSNPNVFALEIDPDDGDKTLMRLIPDEETAIAVYGDDWADYVIDVDVTLFSRFTEGEEIDETYEVDLDEMKKREDLN